MSSGPSRIRILLASSAIVSLMCFAASPAPAATPAVGTAFRSVTLDAVRLSEDFTPVNFNSDYPTVAFDDATNTFHMWVHDDSGFGLASFVHAVSADGVHFTSTGHLSYSGGAPYPAFGAAAEPDFQFVRAVRSGSDWKLLLWTPVEGAGQYDYNVTVFDIGADPASLSVVHQGPVQPVPGGTSGQSNGPWGLVAGSLFADHDAVGGIARWTYTDATPPSVTGPPATQDLITGTPFVNFNVNPADPLAAYVSNAARTLDQGDGTLGTFYALRTYPAGSRTDKQIYYAESANGGASWTTPAALFADGNLVTVDGAPNQGNFSHPEVTLAFGERVLYFSTVAGDGHFVVVTNADVSVVSVPTLGDTGLAALVVLLTVAGLFALRRAGT
jgi:hypothetical protein